MEKLLTIGNTATELRMPASTIRFYEKNGLTPNQQHSSDGRRLFDEDVNNHTIYRGQRIDYYEVLKAGMGDWAKSSWFLMVMASAFTARAAW